MRQGIQQGVIRAAVDDVLEILELRFSDVPANIRKHINECGDIKKLKRALRNAVLVDSLDDFNF